MSALYEDTAITNSSMTFYPISHMLIGFNLYYDNILIIQNIESSHTKAIHAMASILGIYVIWSFRKGYKC